MTDELDPFSWFERCPPLEPEDVLGTYIYFRAMRAAPELVKGKWKEEEVSRAYPRTLQTVWGEDCQRVRRGGPSLFKAAGVCPDGDPPPDPRAALRAMGEFLRAWFLGWHERTLTRLGEAGEPASARLQALRKIIESMDPLLRPTIAEPGLVASVRKWAMKKGVPSDHPILRNLTPRDIAAELAVAGVKAHPLFTGDDGTIRIDYRLIADAIAKRWRRERREVQPVAATPLEPASADRPVATIKSYDLMARLLDEFDEVDRYIALHFEDSNVSLAEALGRTEGAIRKRKLKIRETAARISK